ncbi:recombinase family protein [Streptomyces sp. NBC_00728]|uniref:recombinase family protein n=1 Tax=Streptomyces sp. NBC_00728 TaxID=2903676 RepID=UPI00386B475E
MTTKTRPRRQATRAKAGVDVEQKWTAEELTELAELDAASTLLPDDAPRALLSIRLSVLTEDTTSPARQELDLRRHAVRAGIRVTGVARDLNVSATKKSPFERKELGDWLKNRIPEFDLILFWKLDRFIRRITDLHEAITWCQKYDKNLVSLNDTLDLDSPMAQAMVTFIAAVAEIEAANTKVRVTSLWEHTKGGDEWRVGKPTYGYYVEKVDGKNKLVQYPDEAKVLRYMYRAALRGVPANRIALILNRAKVPTYSNGTWNNQQILRNLRNPAIKGVRTEGGTKSAAYRSKPVLDKNGQEIMVTDEPILTAEEFDKVGEALDTRKKNKRHHEKNRNPTRFLGVMKHRDCGNNINETNNFKKLSSGEDKEYRYLRCPKCRRPGFIIPQPDQMYSWIAGEVIKSIGDHDVVYREYSKGEESRKERKRIQDSISYYMTGLEPGGRYDREGFVKERAQETLDNLITELDKIDPESTKDRWIYVRSGQTYVEHWQSGGVEAMEHDLLRAGITFDIWKEGGEVLTDMKIPDDLLERLIRTTDMN